MNNTVLLGRVVRDIELRYKGVNQTTIAKFTVAVNRKFKKDEADFINCIAFGKTAEIISQYFSKGSQIGIVGRIQTGSYDAQDGTKRFTTDVIVESFSFVGSSKDNGQAASNDNTEVADDITPVNDETLPF